MPKFYDQSYDAVVGSDVERDGMFLEIRDERGQTAAEVFYSDRTSALTFTDVLVGSRFCSWRL
jgi:hypothetical protein